MELPHRPPRAAPQPLLHDLVSCVQAPGLALSGADGRLDGGVRGAFWHDVRLLCRLDVRLDGEQPEALVGQVVGAGCARFVAVSRDLGDAINDPTVVVERSRAVTTEGLTEVVRVVSSARSPVRARLEVTAGSDLATMADVKTGRPVEPLEAELGPAEVGWRRGDLRAVLRADPAPVAVDPVEGGVRLCWDVALEHGQSWQARLTASLHGLDLGPAVFGSGAGRSAWSRPSVACPDPRLAALVDQSLDDLAGLLLLDGDDPFLAAGSPWFLTLFGRDSLWAARMLLPLGTDLALGTLRTLARRQGDRVDADIAEEPGKILHEVRREELALDTVVLPPVYYGSVDATPLWVLLLADAWRWGAPAEQVEALLPAAVRGLRWMAGAAAADGFLRYADQGGPSGHGLTNQGWKDSSDSVQWADGRLAEGPIALSEVQGYAYAAAVAGADLLDAFSGAGSGAAWRAWAADLAAGFRERFWVQGRGDPYPAVALDGAGRPVDSVASNMGHLLGTGLLDPEEVRLVARRLGGPDMDSGFGLRTLSARSARFGPLSYHGGSVWPHDTAIAIAGLAAEGEHEVVASLAAGLLAAAPSYSYRLPELFAGEQRDPGRLPVPYPASCRPQAWAAASGVLLLHVLSGLRPDVPAGRVVVAPLRPSPVGPVSVDGLRVGGAPVRVGVDASGSAQVSGLPPGLVATGDEP